MPSNGSWLLMMDRMNPGAGLSSHQQRQREIFHRRANVCSVWMPVPAYRSASVRAGAENGGEVCTLPSVSAEMWDSLLPLRRVEGLGIIAHIPLIIQGDQKRPHTRWEG